EKTEAAQTQEGKSAQSGKPSDEADNPQPVGIIGVGNQPDQRSLLSMDQRNVSRAQGKTEEQGEGKEKSTPAKIITRHGRRMSLTPLTIFSRSDRKTGRPPIYIQSSAKFHGPCGI